MSLAGLTVRKMERLVSRKKNFSRPRNSYTKLELGFMTAAAEVESSPPTMAARLLLWIIIALLSFIIGWMCWAEIEVVATARGKLVPEGQVKVLQAKENAIIKGIYVTVGQSVEKGQLLLELDPTVSKTENGTIADNLVTAKLDLIRLTAELAGTRPDFTSVQAKAELKMLQQSMYAAHEATFQAKKAEAINNLRSNELVLAGAESDLKKLEMLSSAAREKEERVRPHIGVVMNRFDYMRLKDELTRNDNDVAAQQKHIMALKEQYRGAAERVKQVEQERRTNLLSEIAEINSRIGKSEVDMVRSLQQLDQKQLRAPMAGTIQSLEVATVGGMVTSAQPLATIVPNEAPLIVEAILSSNDIGFVKTGQRAHLKVDSFPFTIYGMLEGTVSAISPDSAVASQSTSSASGNQARPSTLFYKVFVRPDTLHLNGKAGTHRLTAGMSIQVDVKTDKRRIIDLILAPITKNLQEGLAYR